MPSCVNPMRSSPGARPAPPVRPLAALVAGIVLIALAVFLPAAAPAQPSPGQPPRTSLAEIDDEVMCPVCGTPLELATEAPQAQREREFIRRLAGEGRSKEQIKAALVAEFGDEVLALPRARGFDRAAYLVPVAALLLAGVVVSASAGGSRRRAPGSASLDPAPLEVEAAARLETDLKRYDL